MLSKKGFIVMNSIMNMVNALTLTLTGAILNNAISPFIIVLVLIAFICAWIVTTVIPVQKIGNSFSVIFKLDEKSIAGKLVSNIAVTFIYVVIINFVMTLINVGFNMPVLLLAYTSSLQILYIVSYIVSFIVSPLAFKIAINLK